MERERKVVIIMSILFSGDFHANAANELSEIERRIQFREWWCGHFHQNLYYLDK